MREIKRKKKSRNKTRRNKTKQRKKHMQNLEIQDLILEEIKDDDIWQGKNAKFKSPENIVKILKEKTALSSWSVNLHRIFK